MSRTSDTTRSVSSEAEESTPLFPVVPPECQDLPPHHDHCLGCGPANPHGHQLSVRRDAEGVYARHTFDSRHVGAPAIAHGGAVATVLDDLFGFLLYTVAEPAVTRHLSIDYLSPVLLHTPYIARAHLHSRQGRKLNLRATIEDDHGHMVTTATALFLVVNIDHFFLASQRATSSDVPPTA